MPRLPLPRMSLLSTIKHLVLFTTASFALFNIYHTVFSQRRPLVGWIIIRLSNKTSSPLTILS
ncbi:hypothetical protein ANCCAN_29526 [Ancylostoma caninum]|uniref:Uncharacterized protein n=1 Tax=Ancylostoma caninum TaxID=29170 RepID=A0A368EY88_ANCCA|nr:hypothetical protein ANCCAN_29526 [Ancylostoma caninum]